MQTGRFALSKLFAPDNLERIVMGDAEQLSQDFYEGLFPSQ